MVVSFRRLREEEGFAVPARQHPGDAGFDLAVCRYAQVAPDQNAHLCTNIAVAIPRGYFGMVVPRSSTLWHRGLHVSTGIIDSEYRGEVMILVRNVIDRAVSIQAGDRVAQMLVLPLWKGEFVQASELKDGARGAAGFGSTGGFTL